MQGLRTKEWTSKRGKRHEGKPFGKNALRHLLSSAVYTGSISFRGTLYPGEHERIVDQPLWDNVNGLLGIRSAHLRGKPHRSQDALLSGLLQCGCCKVEMRATFTTRAGVRHRYYVCPRRRSADQRCPQPRLSANDAESDLITHLQSAIGTHVSRPVLQQAISRVVYGPAAREIVIELRDGTKSTPDAAGAESPRRTQSNPTADRARSPDQPFDGAGHQASGFHRFGTFATSEHSGEAGPHQRSADVADRDAEQSRTRD